MYKTRNRRILRKYRKLYREYIELDSFLYCEAEALGMDFNNYDEYSNDISRLEALYNKLLHLKLKYGI